MKIHKNVDFGGAAQKQMSPSNSSRKTIHVDLFSSPYDWKQAKTCFWPSGNVCKMVVGVYSGFVPLFLLVRWSVDDHGPFDLEKIVFRDFGSYRPQSKSIWSKIWRWSWFWRPLGRSSSKTSPNWRKTDFRDQKIDFSPNHFFDVLGFTNVVGGWNFDFCSTNFHENFQKFVKRISIFFAIRRGY